MEILSHCPLCGSSHLIPYKVCKDYTVSGETFNIVQCEDCQFVFTNPRPTEAEIGKYYQAQAYISHSDTQKGLLSWLYHQVRRRALRQKLQLIEKRTQDLPKTLLDYGCGTGYFLETCLQAGWKVDGIEPDEGARALAKERVHTDLQPSLAQEYFKPLQYSVITLWHVLEHIHTLKETLRNLREHLHPQGKMVIAVPNLQASEALHYGEYWAAFDVPRHLYHFTPKTMQFLLRQVGLQIREVLPMPFDAYYVSLLSEKYQTGKIRYWQGFWQGYHSNQKARKNVENCSSLIYVASPM
jgi:2-polyprenyl-3-methyl-5-hydroxy-6-metoxy-1,4-benzoquinol methylase